MSQLDQSDAQIDTGHLSRINLIREDVDLSFLGPKYRPSARFPRGSTQQVAQAVTNNPESAYVRKVCAGYQNVLTNTLYPGEDPKTRNFVASAVRDPLVLAVMVDLLLVAWDSQFQIWDAQAAGGSRRRFAVADIEVGPSPSESAPRFEIESRLEFPMFLAISRIMAAHHRRITSDPTYRNAAVWTEMRNYGRQKRILRGVEIDEAFNRDPAGFGETIGEFAILITSVTEQIRRQNGQLPNNFQSELLRQGTAIAHPAMALARETLGPTGLVRQRLIAEIAEPRRDRPPPLVATWMNGRLQIDWDAEVVSAMRDPWMCPGPLAVQVHPQQRQILRRLGDYEAAVTGGRNRYGSRGDIASPAQVMWALTVAVAPDVLGIEPATIDSLRMPLDGDGVCDGFQT